MFMKKAVLAVLFVIFTCVSALWAGDSAVFVDLGFSQDGRMYMFGQYGVNASTLCPWAEIYVVDVNRNVFVTGGRASITHNVPIRAGQDGSGIFHQLVSNNSSLVSRNGIIHQNQGLPLYISRDENPPSYGDRITFRDFLSGKSYVAQLFPTINGTGQNARSQFYIDLKVYNTLETSSLVNMRPLKGFTVGTPSHTRQGIVQYNIKRVIIDERGGSVIFVIEMKQAAVNGFNIRYMIEAIRL